MFCLGAAGPQAVRCVSQPGAHMSLAACCGKAPDAAAHAVLPGALVLGPVRPLAAPLPVLQPRMPGTCELQSQTLYPDQSRCRGVD